MAEVGRRDACRALTAVAGALALTMLGTAAAHGGPPAAPDRPGAPAAPGHWTGSWEAAASGTAAPLPGASIRNVVRTSVGGTAVRVRVSNRLGTLPLVLGAATVARQRPNAPKSPKAVSGTMRALTFGGRKKITVPAGRDVVSDPLPLNVPAAANLLVTLHTPGDSGPATYHRDALQTNFLALDGNRAAEVGGAGYRATTTSWYYVTGVDVLRPQAPGSVVALGDSLTDGSGSTPNANRRWPDRLAERLRALPPGRRQGVLNAGVAGNRLLREGRGPSASARFDADVLSRTGVRTLIVLEGVNDIKGTPDQTDPAALVAAYRELVRRAHARGIRVVGATITPFGGHGGHTAARERVRRAVNRLIRGGGVFDAVADFDAVVRDPSRPDRLRAAYDPGDHLHFNDAGMRALADSIDLMDLAGPAR
ncbi:SGNH/GDSL hydrolase family protein [Streptomyces ortus]|uniref:SGNH/GDSL hydrolase family protein n=1 Tax=Streptomyces ortus TaxID=2867268 RepID=A0ABT3VF50_9ACTN|nr:SGNH/GDSL hydrolase family protein [Streptomyces ortus]MCX4237285.1 SGNH/GDSL hydrolase family protein [Streptomyces ortus]